jgi:hypothetical protein
MKNISQQQTASKPWDDSERFMPCPKCGEMIDLHNMHQVRVHAGSLPHPATRSG